jgi:hypothetical protein
MFLFINTVGWEHLIQYTILTSFFHICPLHMRFDLKKQIYVMISNQIWLFICNILNICLRRVCTKTVIGMCAWCKCNEGGAESSEAPPHRFNKELQVRWNV